MEKSAITRQVCHKHAHDASVCFHQIEEEEEEAVGKRGHRRGANSGIVHANKGGRIGIERDSSLRIRTPVLVFLISPEIKLVSAVLDF